MSDDLISKVETLDDKQAIYAAQRLAEALFKRVSPPSLTTMVNAIDLVGAQTELAGRENIQKATLKARDGGNVARAVLAAWAANPEGAEAVNRVLQQYKPSTQDLGILSVPVALGLTYALIAMDLDLDLGFVKIKKKGLNSVQQTAVVKKTMEPLLKAIGSLKGG